MELSDLATTSGEWLRGAGADPDVVLSSRVRLARNLAGFPFATRASEDQRAEILTRAKAAVENLAIGPKRWFVDLSTTSHLETRFLVERHLISRELAMGKGPRGAAFGSDERVSVMVNEEDHLRLQAIHSGFSLDEAFEDAKRLDVALESLVAYATSPSLGYLTACPTNVGTGLRASVMLHLPSLVQTKQTEKVLQAAQRTGLAVRGFYGEGTRALGDLYQVSNQVTLGLDEKDVLSSLRRMIPTIVQYEREVRQHLLDNRKVRLEDRVHRALAILRAARTIDSDEAMEHLSAVRQGVVLGLLPTLDPKAVNDLFVLVQPAHLQKMARKELDADERDIRRATLLRERLS